MIEYFWLIDGTLTVTTTPGQSEPGSKCNEAILHILQSSMTGALLSDSLLSYPGYSFVGGPYPFVEIQWHILVPQLNKVMIIDDFIHLYTAGKKFSKNTLKWDVFIYFFFSKRSNFSRYSEFAFNLTKDKHLRIYHTTTLYFVFINKSITCLNYCFTNS